MSSTLMLLFLLAVSSAVANYSAYDSIFVTNIDDLSPPCIWAQKELTYRVFSHPTLNRDIIRQCLDKWENVSDFKFLSSLTRTANFYFMSMSNQNWWHGYLRDNVVYIGDSLRHPNVFVTTVLHEVGHLLGLQDNKDNESIMYAGANRHTDIPAKDADLLRRTYVDRCTNQYRGFTTLPNGELVGLAHGYCVHENGTRSFLTDLLNRRGALTWNNVYVNREGRYRMTYDGYVFDDQGKMVLDMTRHLRHGERITAVQSVVSHDIFYTNHKRAYVMGQQVNVSNTDFVVMGVYRDSLIDTDYMLHGPTTRPMREVFPRLMCDNVCDSELRPPYRKTPSKYYLKYGQYSKTYRQNRQNYRPTYSTRVSSDTIQTDKSPTGDRCRVSGGTSTRKP